MDVLEARKRARGATLSKATAFKTIGVDVDGELLAVREPTVREHAEIMKAAQVSGTQDVDFGKLRVAAVVKCARTAEAVLEGDKPKLETVPVVGPGGKPQLDKDGKPVTRERPIVTAGQRIFDDADMEALLDQPLNSFVSLLGDAALELMNAKQEDARKSA